jgi:hypothetical protein
MTVGLIAGPAQAADQTVNVRPYPFNAFSIGATAPGQANSELCLITVDNDGVNYGGEINDVVVGGRANELNIEFKTQAGATVPTCVPTAIQFTIRETGTGITPVALPKHGGSYQVVTNTAVQAGILAKGSVVMRLKYSAGQVAKLPAGAALAPGETDTLNNPAGAEVDFFTKEFTTKVKSNLDLNACSDNRYVIDAGNIVDTTDLPPAPSPKAWAFDDTTNPWIDAQGYDPNDTAGHPGIEDTYPATIRTCAQNQDPVPGKDTAAKGSVTGAGNVKLWFIKAITSNPRTWDGTRGKTCGTVKTAGTLDNKDPIADTPLDFSTTYQASRVLVCKGNYGEQIPFGIDVRTWNPTPANGDQGGGPSHPNSTHKDEIGILHPGAPTLMLDATFG